MASETGLKQSVGILLARPDGSGIWLSKRLPKAQESKFEGFDATPGGHVEGGEGQERAIHRELREETGLTLSEPVLHLITGEYDGSTNRYEATHFWSTTPVWPYNTEPDKHGDWTFFRNDQLDDLLLMPSTAQAITVARARGLLKDVPFPHGLGLIPLDPSRQAKFFASVTERGEEIYSNTFRREKRDPHTFRVIWVEDLAPGAQAVCRFGMGNDSFILLFGRTILRQTLVHELSHELDWLNVLDVLEGSEDRAHTHGLIYEEIVVALMEAGWVSGPKRNGLFHIGLPHLALEKPYPES